jgi:dihydroxyacetone kinase DhaKLM complex PTS-EIIA-like component DhaM
VSHSRAIADGLCELLRQFAGEDVPIVSAGGGPDGSLGTDGVRIAAAIAEAGASSGVIILMGSAVLSVKSALADANGVRATMADAPLVEGAVSAAVAASAGASLADVVAAAEEARDVGKL